MHAVAAGASSFAVGEESASYGYGAAAYGNNGVAIGAGSGALNDNATALGGGANAVNANSTAVGYASAATADNSVALGANSQADRANSVSVGSVGQERQITNVAAGTVAAGSTDAVNGGQLNTTNQAVAANAANIAGNTAAIGTINNSAVFYSNAGHTSVVLGNGTTPVTVGNVAAGVAGTDAVNKSQLDALTVATTTASHLFAADGATDGSEDALAIGMHAVAAGASSFAVGEESAAYGYNTLANGANTVALGSGSFAWGDNASAVGSLATAMGVNSTAVGYGSVAGADNSVALGAGSQADRANSVSVGTVGNERQITNVAAGTVAAGSTDAVNGDQLNTTNQAVAQNTTDISTINSSAVFYADASHTAVMLGDGNTPVTVGNVADGSAAHDAVNKGQLDAAVAGVSSDLGALADSAVTYDDDSKEQITLAGANGTRISNLQASSVLTDAATVGQISDLLSAFGGGAMLQAGGSVIMPNYAIQGGSYNNVGDALNALDGVLSGALASIASLQQAGAAGPRVAVGGADDGSDAASVSAGTKGVAIGSNAAAGGEYGTAVGGDSYAAGPNDTAIGGNAKVNADGSTAVGANTTITAEATNAVAVGEGATVTAASGTAIGQGSSVTAEGAVALGQGSVADRANTVSVGSVGNERQIVNVAAGSQATDAANYGQVTDALATAKAYADAGDTQTLQKANAYTDQRLGSFATSNDLNTLRDQVNTQFRVVDRRINQVGAMGAAMSQMSFSTQGIATENRLGVGVGGYRGQAALSVGYSRQLSPKANVTFGAAISGNETTGGVGVGIGW